MAIEHNIVPREVLRSTVAEVRMELQNLSGPLPEGAGAEAATFNLLLECLSHRLPDPFRGELTVFYTRLYWFNRFIREWQAAHGMDAGLEQQAFKLLEVAPDGVDWSLVEGILESART